MTQVVAAPYVLTGAPHSVLLDGALALDDGKVVGIGPRAEVESRFGPAEALDAVILPAMVNAHVHLELSHLQGRIAGGDGLAAWISRLLAERNHATTYEIDQAIERGVASLGAAGVAAIGEVTNTLAALAPLAARGFSGTLFHEVLGLSPERIDASLAKARALRERIPSRPPGLAVITSPHAVYTTHPSAIAALLRAGAASIHLAETPEERLFCTQGAGPLADLANRLGPSRIEPLGRSAVAVVANHLGPGSLVVHAVDLDAEDLTLLARSGAAVAVCPRSNLHISGKLPDLPALIAAGVPLAVGTDSLASSPSLSPLAELAVLRRAFPDIPAGRLLALAWNGAAVGAPSVGQLVVGHTPGVVAAPLSGARPADAATWLLESFGPAERSFDWIAAHRPELTV